MSPTLLALHAHPDDEAIFTGGLLARAAALGWRCVVVVATSGEGGRALRDGEPLGALRRRETQAAAGLLGVSRVAFLGYWDSGMAGDTPPDGALATADPEILRTAVQSIVDEERPSLVLSYDLEGMYGHPDHLVIHQIGRAIDTTASLWEATIDRSELGALREQWLLRGMPDEAWPASTSAAMGMDHPGLVRLDVSAEMETKHAAIVAHDSQVLEADSFMGLPPGVFHQLLVTEWYHLVQETDDAYELAAIAHLLEAPNAP